MSYRIKNHPEYKFANRQIWRQKFTGKDKHQNAEGFRVDGRDKCLKC